MQEKKEVSDYMAKGYLTTVKKKDNVFVAAIPELGIVKKNSKLEDAFSAVEQAQKELFQNYLDNGYASWIPEPSGASCNKSFKSGASASWTEIFRPASTLTVVLVFLCVFALAGGPVASRVYSKAKAVAARTHAKVKNAEAKILNLDALPPEKVEHYREKMHKICANIKPITDEIKVLWQ